MVTWGLVSTPTQAQDQIPPCPAYEIEGSIDPPVLGDDGAVRTASAYLHTQDDPLSNHQVIATFTDAEGSVIDEPVILVTDAGGRARIDVPVGAESVDFVAEGPSDLTCSTADGSDPRVLLRIVPASSSGAPSPAEELARTGPVTDAVVVLSLLLLAIGASVGTGWGRSRALSARSARGKSLNSR